MVRACRALPAVLCIRATLPAHVVSDHIYVRPPGCHDCLAVHCLVDDHAELPVDLPGLLQRVVARQIVLPSPAGLRIAVTFPLAAPAERRIGADEDRSSCVCDDGNAGSMTDEHTR
jgi:hypothetical protein